MDKGGQLLLEIAALTNVGLIRKSNEDAIAVGTELICENVFGPKRFTLPGNNCVLMIADGMGGHSQGALASQTALSFLVQPSGSATEVFQWENALHFANDAIYECMERTPSARGMGTTIVGVAIGEAGIIHFNVGDSRLYRHSSGLLMRLSHDDVPLGTSGPGSSHLITQSLGGHRTNTGIRPHVGATSPLTNGDTLLLCSDGLTDMVADNDVALTLDVTQDLEKCVSALLDLALANGGRDNISIIAVRTLTVTDSFLS
jgi:serine/threonine protein phosphatase PrpC